MAKKNSIMTLIFILLSLFSFIQTIDPIDVKVDTNDVNWLEYYKEDKGLIAKVADSLIKEVRYAVEFHIRAEPEVEYSGPFYIKIEVAVESGNSPLLCFSHDDSFCETRDILMKNPGSKSVYIWAKKEQYEDASFEPYFTVKCAGDVKKCAYTITVTGSENIVMDPTFMYSYLVTNRNKEMEYVIDSSKVSADQRLVICLDGSADARLNFKSEVEVADKGTIHCVNLVKKEEDTNFGKFSIVKANEGDYLTITGHTYKHVETNLGRVDGFNMINSNPISSYIEYGVTHEQCFPLSRELLESSSDILYVTGKIHNKYGWFFLGDENGQWITDVDVEILDGMFSYIFKNPKKLRYLCFEIPNEGAFSQDYVIFSFKVMDYGKLLDVYNYEESLVQGGIHRHLLPKGKIGVYHFSKSIVPSKKNDYTLSRIRGISKLYFGECKTFPNCQYTTDDLKKFNTSIPAKINNDFIFTSENDRNQALATIKDVMVVHCEDGLEDFCEFDTSLFAKGQDIVLLEERTFSKFIQKGETGQLIVDLQSHRIISILVIDLTIYSGDVTFTIKETDLPYKQFYLSNKVLFTINMPGQVLDKVTIKYEANLNTFFNAKYAVDSVNNEQLEDKIPSGESYLVQINPSSQLKTKTVYLVSPINYNHEAPFKTAFMANFFEINCKFHVNRLFDRRNVTFSDGYAQDYVKPKEAQMDMYDYQIQIEEVDPSNNNNKMCMIYVSGVEEDNENQYLREIVVPQNIGQQIIFDNTEENNFHRVRFTYPVADVKKDFIIFLNVIDKAHYVMNGYLNGHVMEDIQDYDVAVGSMYYMTPFDLQVYCKEDQLCAFTLDVEMRNKIVQTNPMIEVTFREILNIPTYFQKGSAKMDYVCGDLKYYLYTDIGRNDVGEITLNFMREFGSLWTRIVRKDLKSPEKDANWRKYYRLPSPEWDDSLPFDSYTRKVIINTKDTEDCINGCYLLMTIQINDIGEYVPNYIFYYFSIIVKITSNKKTYNDIPKVVIQVNEFVVGSLDVTEMDDRLITEFYEVWFPHDSDEIEFDWQSSLASLYINVGDTRPITTRADFVIHPEGVSGVYNISKTAILEKAKEKNLVPKSTTSIQDINIVIGVWTNITTSGKYELYSLRVHQHDYSPEEDDLDIINIAADQKVVCKPRMMKYGYDYIYRCLFILEFIADPTIDNPFFVYGYSMNPIGESYILANFISVDDYNNFDKDTIKNLIPTPENAEYNAFKEGVDYIYINSLPQHKVLFVNLYSYFADDLALINSLPIYNSFPEDSYFELYPNPYTEQIFSCRKQQLILTFPVKGGMSATIEVIAGEAEIGWKNEGDVFKVKGFRDRLELFSQNNQLVVKNLRPVNEQKNGMEDPGFLFYVKYQTRETDFNFDDVPFGKTTEISYRETDLPIVLYSKLINIFVGVSVSITFKENNAENYGEYLATPITLTATVLDQNKIYTTKKKKDKSMKPADEISVTGYYDPAVKTAMLYLSKEKIDSYNIKESDNPTLYVRIDKSPYNQQTIFNFFNVEAEISGINDLVAPVEKVYHYRKLGVTGIENDMVFYPLKCIANKIFVRIQVAINNDNIDFAITSKFFARYNSTFDYFKAFKERGKVIVTLIRPDDAEYLYLSFFRKDPSKNNEKLSNYAFKYINAASETEFFDYKMMYQNITIKEDNANKVITCTFNKIHVDADNVDITYFLKVVDNKTYIYGEEMNTIAVTESPALIYYAKNPLPGVDGDNDKIQIKTEELYDQIVDNWAYITVVAQVQQQNIIEYVAYNGIMKIRPGPGGNGGDGSNNTVLFGVIGGILGVIVIGLVVVIVYFQFKNKSLLNQVKHVSFQKTNTNMDPNLLLQKNQEINPN